LQEENLKRFVVACGGKAVYMGQEFLEEHCDDWEDEE
jgi:hypothetical protein